MEKIKNLVIIPKVLNSSFTDAAEFVYNYLKFAACDNNLDKIEKLIEDNNFLKIKTLCEESTETVHYILILILLNLSLMLF